MWGHPGIRLVARFYAGLAGLALFITWKISHAAFVPAAVVVAALTVAVVFGLIKLRQQFERYPMHPEDAKPPRKGRPDSVEPS